jgi:YD repeat-containing protein
MKTIQQLIFLPVLLAGLFLRSADAATLSCEYDSAGRLVKADYGSGKSVSYTYDSAGNLLRSQAAVFTDTDNDGLEDSWETTFFGDLSRTGLDDKDQDGSSDRAEFLAGTTPTNAVSVLKVQKITSASGVSASLEWSAVPGKYYRIQFKDSLKAASWTDLPGEVPATGPTATKTDATLPRETERYYRVVLVP